MRKFNIFHNQRRTFKSYSKHDQKYGSNLNDLNEFINSPKFSTKELKSKLLKIDNEYNYFLNPTYKKKYPNVYKNFVENRINDHNNVMDLFTLILSKDTDSFAKIYRKTKGKSELLDDMIIKLSMNINNVDFILEINDQKDNFLGSTGIFTINKPDEYYEKFNYDEIIEDNFKKYEKIRWYPSDCFFNNVLKNTNNELSKCILSQYNIKLNKKYNKLVLKNMIKNKNEELIKIYINNPSFSLKKQSAEHVVHFIESDFFAMIIAFILCIVYIFFGLFFICYGLRNDTTNIGYVSYIIGCCMLCTFLICIIFT